MTVITNIEDLRVLAQKRVPRMFYDYADSGSLDREHLPRQRERLPEDQAAPARGGQHGKPQHRARTMVGQDVAMPVAHRARSA